MDSHSDTARSKLDQILQDLAIKAEESTCLVEEDEALKGSPSDSDAMPPPTTPSKRSGRAPRKRKKKELISDELSESNRPTYILKLFDRSIDMAQFHRNSSMYAMTRAWALNNPSATYELGVSGEQSLQHDGFDLSYSSLSCGKLDDSLHESIPHASKQHQNISCLDDMIDAVRNIDILRTDNVSRWRQVRGRWRQASFRLQENHASSLAQLKSLFTQP